MAQVWMDAVIITDKCEEDYDCTSHAFWELKKDSPKQQKHDVTFYATDTACIVQYDEAIFFPIVHV